LLGADAGAFGVVFPGPLFVGGECRDGVCVVEFGGFGGCGEVISDEG
jgi:hypothetical protein